MPDPDVSEKDPDPRLDGVDEDSAMPEELVDRDDNLPGDQPDQGDRPSKTDLEEPDA